MKTFLSFLIICCTTLNVFGATLKYVRLGAIGSGSGNDWANAYPSMPTTIPRGTDVYVADGNYTSYIEFDDPVSGTILNRIIKATESAHGTDTGWSSNYGDGEAVFDTWIVKTDYWEFDGVVGGGPASWNSGHGFKLSHVANDSLGLIGNGGVSNLDHITFKHVKLTCNAFSGPPYQTGVYWAAASSDITFSYCAFVGIPGDMFQMRGHNNWLVEYSYFNGNWQDPTRHGDVFEADWNSSNFTVRWNFFDDVVGTYVVGHHTTDNLTGLNVYGNIFKDTECGNGIIATLNPGSGGTIHNALIYNNTFIGARGLSGGINIVNSPTGCVAQNNLFYDCDNVAFTIPHNYNWFFDSGVQSEVNIQNGSGNPFVNLASDDFHLTADTNPGNPTIFTVDMLSIVYSANGGWTRGAISFIGGGSVPNAPSGLNIITIGVGELLVGWSDNSVNETGFKLERSSTGGGSGFAEIAQPAANATSYSNTGLTSGTTYYYRIRAYNGAGNSSYSSEANGTTGTKPPIILSPPGIVYIYGTGIGHISP